MKDVDTAINELLEAVRNTEEYKEYRLQRDKIKLQPQLQEQIDAYREENFTLQNDTPGEEMFQKLEQFEEKYGEFRENPFVNDFLEAELAFCRKMQEVNLRITEGLQFE